MKIQWTTRHTVVTVLAILTAALYALAATGTVHTDIVSNGKIESLCIGFGFGLFIPGSPLGLALSKAFPPKGQMAIMPTLADLQAIAADAQTQGATLAVNLHIDSDAATTTPVERPVRVPPSRTGGGALFEVLGFVVFGAAAFTLLHGCGAQLTDSQRSALAIETQRCIANERQITDRTEVCTAPGVCHAATEAEDRADLAAERMRCDATRAAIVDGGVP